MVWNRDRAVTVAFRTLSSVPVHIITRDRDRDRDRKCASRAVLANSRRVSYHHAHAHANFITPTRNHRHHAHCFYPGTARTASESTVPVWAQRGMYAQG